MTPSPPQWLVASLGLACRHDPLTFQLLIVPVVDVLVGRGPPAQEAVLMIRLHVLVKLVRVVEPLAAELA